MSNPFDICLDDSTEALKQKYYDLHRRLMHSGWHIISAHIGLQLAPDAMQVFRGLAVYQPGEEDY